MKVLHSIVKIIEKVTDVLSGHLQAGIIFFLMVMLMISVGGIGRFPGVILGAFIITIGNELLRDTGQYRLLLLGTCVVFSILFLPNGILQLRERLAEVFRRE